MTTLHLNADLPEVTPLQRLAGWHLELCVELLGNAEARVFVRAVERVSLKAAELQRGLLFQRLDTRFDDVAGWAEAHRAELDALIGTARRTRPTRENLYTAVEYDRQAWERVQDSIDRWARRRSAVVRGGAPPHQMPPPTSQSASGS